MDLFIRTVGCAGNGENRTGEPRLQHQTIAVPETHRRGIAPSLPPLSVRTHWRAKSQRRSRSNGDVPIIVEIEEAALLALSL